MAGYKPTRDQQILIGTGVPIASKEKYKRRALIARAARLRVESPTTRLAGPKR